jgi:hypothetical protein
MIWITEKIKKKGNSILIIVLCILLAISMLNSCEKGKENKQLLQNLNALDISNQKFETEILENKEKITSQNQIILTQQQAIDNGLIEIEKLKKIKSKVRFVTNTQIDTVFVPFDRIVRDTIDSSFGVKKYFTFTEPKGWYSLDGFSSDIGVGIDKLSIKNDYSIYIADKKVNLFGKSNPEVILHNKNPYTETIQMQNVVITVYKPFYKKNSFWTGVGFLGGFLLAK